MSILLIAGSPSERSRTSALLDDIGLRLQKRGAFVEKLLIRDISPQALVLADVSHRSVQTAIDKVIAAKTIVIATPIYKASYTGVLKAFLDLLPQTGFKGKAILPVGLGGSAAHMLALDYALRPVLQSLSARHVLPGVFALDSQLVLLPEGAYQIDELLAKRLEDAIKNLTIEGHLHPTKGPQHANSPARVAAADCALV